MKIALFTDGIFPNVVGGIQRHSYYLCKNLVKQNVQVLLFHTAAEESDKLLSAFSDEERMLITPVFVKFPTSFRFPGHYIADSYYFSKAMYKAFLPYKNEVFFVYSKNYCSWYYLKQKKKGVQLPPIGVKLHGYEVFQSSIFSPNPSYWVNHVLHAYASRYNSVNADYVFSYGGKITDIVKRIGVSSKAIIELPTGIEKGWLVDSPKEGRAPLTFAFIGRFTKRKGVDYINNALKRLLVQDKKFKFVFMGPIPEDHQVKDERVYYYGEVKDAGKQQAILDEADVLVCPSLSEGMPNVIMEGMARGCAIIATDVGAVAKMVDSSNGWLIQPGKQEELDRAMDEAISLERPKLKLLQLASTSKVSSQFLWETIIKDLLSKLQERLNTKSIHE